MSKSPTVRALLTRNLLFSVSLCFAATVLIAVLSSFDLEDQIFENQVSRKADEIAATQRTSSSARGEKVTGLEMEHYLGHDALPPVLKAKINSDWPDGEYEITVDQANHYHIAVRSNAGVPSYLVFNARPYVRSVDQVVKFIVIVGILGVIMLAIALVFLRRLAKRLSIPVEVMAASAARHSAIALEPSELTHAPKEVAFLAEALLERDRRIDELVERERQFNRDVSHELRTPLSIAVGAAELLEVSGSKNPAMTRLTSSLGNMRLLTEGILWLGREPDAGAACNVWQNCESAAQINQHMRDHRKVSFSIMGQRDTNMPVPDAVAQVILGNLIRNAFNFTKEGNVSILILPRGVLIEDTGVGFGKPGDVSGFGIGLSLTQRLCTHFGLELSVRPGEKSGTIAKLTW
ncbi:sensor histidine kinase [Parasphingorhabdus litoris]|nr:HAMP domain-containing sensor histidine kinase [Parasphingorhabdus litoris]